MNQKAKGKIYLTKQIKNQTKILIDEDDFEYLLKQSALLKEKVKEYDELFNDNQKLCECWERLRKENDILETRVKNCHCKLEEVEPEEVNEFYCEICDSQLKCKSSLNVHLNCMKHLKNEEAALNKKLLEQYQEHKHI